MPVYKVERVRIARDAQFIWVQADDPEQAAERADAGEEWAVAATGWETTPYSDGDMDYADTVGETPDHSYTLEDVARLTAWTKQREFEETHG